MEYLSAAIMLSSLVFSIAWIAVRIMTYRERMFKLEAQWIKGESYEDVFNIIINKKEPIPESEMQDLVERAMEAQERQE